MNNEENDMIAALYVQKNGCYGNIYGIDPWDKDRDARTYSGPYPVVAHPPCERWGSYWFGSPSSPTRYNLGDDGGCFDAAIRSVRMFGGVLEHPAYSRAWSQFELNKPPMSGGWVVADFCGGWTCYIEQGNYGHRARKPTWLYACHIDPPSLIWGKSAATAKLEDGFHSAKERAAAKANGWKRISLGYLSHRERAATPIPFRDLLINIARSVKKQ